MARSITCRFRGVHGIPFRALTAGRTAEGAALMIHVQEPLVKQIAPNQYRRNCLSFQVMTHLKHFVKVCERIRTGLFCPYVLLLLYLNGKRNILLLWDSFSFPDCLFRQKGKTVRSAIRHEISIMDSCKGQPVCWRQSPSASIIHRSRHRNTLDDISLLCYFVLIFALASNAPENNRHLWTMCGLRGRRRSR